MIQSSLFDAPAPTRNLLESHSKETLSSKPVVVVHRGRPCLVHRDCGEHVWLKAEDAGIGGPFYWVRKEEVRAA